MDEKELLIRLVELRREGQPTTTLDGEVAALLDGLRERVVAYCRRLLGDPESAAEVAQDALLTAWATLDKFEGRSTFATWVLGIARFKALRRNQKHTELLLDDGVLDLEADHEVVGAYGILRAKERGRVLLEAISGLPKLEQDILYMRYALNIPVDQITRNLDLQGRSGARGILVRSRRHLNRALREILEREGLTSGFLRLTAGEVEGLGPGD